MQAYSFLSNICLHYYTTNICSTQAEIAGILLVVLLFRQNVILSEAKDLYRGYAASQQDSSG